jgi:ATP-dependent DNA helicase PIF1
VERSNNQRLNALSTDGYSYPAADGGALQDRAAREKALANFMAPANLSVKVDAQVMLIKNVDETLVNGSMGRVIGFSHKLQYAIDAKGEWRPEGIYGDEYEDESEQKRQKREELREQLQAKTHNSKPFPVVRFTVPGGGFRDMLVEPDSFKTELPNGEIQVSRTQVPLILAWAMSIHKSQGQSGYHCVSWVRDC